MLILLDFSAWQDFIRFLRGLFVPLVVLARALVLLGRAGLAAISQRAVVGHSLGRHGQWAVDGRALWGGQPAGSGPAVLGQGRGAVGLSSIEWVPWAGAADTRPTLHLVWVSMYPPRPSKKFP